MAKIHPTAIVEDGAQLGADVEIGPLAHIGPDVKLGDGVRIAQGAIIDGHTTIGSMCQIFPYACIGMKTQDLKYKDGSVSYVEIGERTVIREFATVHLGTADGEKTVIGSDCLFMCYCCVRPYGSPVCSYLVVFVLFLPVGRIFYRKK